MFGFGVIELLVISVILVLLIGVPVIAGVIVLVVMSRSNASKQINANAGEVQQEEL